jgi:DEAD/DEAH box helicase domain-containing protein
VVADVDPGDVGSALDVGEGKEHGFRARLYLFDSFAGGTGLSEFAFTTPHKLVEAAASLLLSCNCKAAEGCPRCTVLSWCESQNQELSKKGAVKMLQELGRLR